MAPRGAVRPRRHASRVALLVALAGCAALQPVPGAAAPAPVRATTPATVRDVAPGAARGTTAANPDAVRHAIEASNAAYVAAWKKRDPDAFAKLFAIDGAVLQDDGHMVIGRAAIRDQMSHVMDQIGMQDATISTTNLFVLGDTAYETGRWVFTLIRAGRAAPDSGRYVEVWKRQRDGAWKMWRDISVPNE